MVNVFIVHSGSDYDYVKTHMEPYLRGAIDDNGEPAEFGGSSNILTLESGKNTSSNWKTNALKLIKKAQVVIVVIGDDSNNPGKEDTMGWEVRQADKHNKLILLHDRGSHEVPKYLKVKNKFTRKEEDMATKMSLFEIKTRIDDYARGYYNIFSPKYEDMDPAEKLSHKGELLDQYKMFQKTSEDLVVRRQNVNSFYITVNSALTALVGIIIGLVKPPANILLVVLMCVAGVILDVSWINILQAYGTLNAAKMKVIHLLEEQLPVALYDAEWQIMSDKLNSKKYVSFTNSEKRIPKLFGTVYIVIIIAILIYAFANGILKF